MMPTRKIYKMNFQWECDGWGETYTEGRQCEETSVSLLFIRTRLRLYCKSLPCFINVVFFSPQGEKLMRFYRKDLRTGVLKETTTVRWNAVAEHKKMWINSTYRQNNDYVESWWVNTPPPQSYCYLFVYSVFNNSLNGVSNPRPIQDHRTT